MSALSAIVLRDLKLALRAGVEIQEYQREAPELKEAYDHLRKLLEDAVIFYRTQLFNNNTILSYLREKRGLTDATIETFGLGYAPSGYDNALKHFTQRDYTEQDLIDAGLLTDREDGKRYDKFRNRIMIPIRDENGKMAGFGARIVDDVVDGVDEVDAVAERGEPVAAAGQRVLVTVEADEGQLRVGAQQRRGVAAEAEGRVDGDGGLSGEGGGEQAEHPFEQDGDVGGIGDRRLGCRRRWSDCPLQRPAPFMGGRLGCPDDGKSQCHMGNVFVRYLGRWRGCRRPSLRRHHMVAREGHRARCASAGSLRRMGASAGARLDRRPGRRSLDRR